MDKSTHAGGFARVINWGTHTRGPNRKTDRKTGKKSDPGANQKVGLAANQTDQAEKGRTAPDTTCGGPGGQEKETDSPTSREKPSPIAEGARRKRWRLERDGKPDRRRWGRPTEKDRTQKSGRDP